MIDCVQVFQQCFDCAATKNEWWMIVFDKVFITSVSLYSPFYYTVLDIYPGSFIELVNMWNQL